MNHLPTSIGSSGTLTTIRQVGGVNPKIPLSPFPGKVMADRRVDGFWLAVSARRSMPILARWRAKYRRHHRQPRGGAPFRRECTLTEPPGERLAPARGGYRWNDA